MFTREFKIKLVFSGTGSIWIFYLTASFSLCVKFRKEYMSYKNQNLFDYMKVMYECKYI